MTPLDPAVVEVLATAQRRGTIGPAPLERHIDHAFGFLPWIGEARSVLDLGTGAGLPGLVIAAARPELEVVLLDARQGRTDELRRAVARLGWDHRVRVITGQAEVLCREPELAAHFDVVVARSFGPPRLTAPAAAPFLVEGGRLVVSEPPEPEDRWPAALLAKAGLRRLDDGTSSYACFQRITSTRR